jgi:error-prone DNA polymerase
MVSSDDPMLVDFESLQPGTDTAARKSVRRARTRPAGIPPAVPLWNEDDLLQLLRAEAEALARDDLIRMLEDYRGMLEEIGVVHAADLAGLRARSEVLIAGRRVATARDGAKALMITLDDGTGLAEAVFPSESQNRAGSVLFGTELMLISGTTTKEASFRATNAWDLRTLLRDWTTQNTDAG